MPASTSAASNRRSILLVLLAAALVMVWWDAEPEPHAATTAPRDSTAPARVALTPEQRAESVHEDSVQRAYAAELVRDWLGPQRWIVTPRSDTLVEFTEAQLTDSSVADVMAAFVTIAGLRAAGAQVELLGGATTGRAVLAGNVDSLVKEGVDDRLSGCVMPLVMVLRPVGDAPAWAHGFVPGMVERVAPADGDQSTVGTRLLEALPDTGDHLYAIDTLRRVPWPPTRVQLWRIAEDDVEVLVASRSRSSGPDGTGQFVHEQMVLAERPLGTDRPFTTVETWHSAYDTDDTRSQWPEGALRVGPRRRFALLLGFRGKEGGGGTMLMRVEGKWRETVEWSSGC
jgi:hypothetical protein